MAYVEGRRLGLIEAVFWCLRELASDALWLLRKGTPWYWPRAFLRRVTKYSALYQGYRQGFRQLKEAGRNDPPV